MGLPSKPFLLGSVKYWKRAHTHRQKRLLYWRKEYQRFHAIWQELADTCSDNDPKRKAAWREQDRAHGYVKKWEALRDEAGGNLKKRHSQLEKYVSDKKPKIVTWSTTKISPNGVFGALGLEEKVTPHYAASPRARNLTEGINLTRGFDGFHRGKGWGGVSYHYLIPDTGELILGRSTMHKGAHVLNTNYGNVGINFFCTAGDQPTKAQAQTYLWLLANAHTNALPKRHRTDRDLRKADIRGHNQWPGQSTGCPGNFTPSNLKAKGR